ncbi:hypothetical protein HY085_00940 [Candidatus Gottesmanbacteria bacterium]|nr:hypothetical protein [Candidatus Gottesmanbacteria bacterium]
MIPWEGNDLIVGCLLGDGRLECRSKKGTARFRVHQADSQKDYTYFKWNLLKEICSQKPKQVTSFHKKYQKTITSWFFNTKTTKQLGLLQKLFYRGNRKIVPRNLGKMLTAKSLAFWVMDDGCFDDNTLILNTQNFSFNKQRILQKVLFENFGLKSGINRDRSNFRLRIAKESFSSLVQTIEPYIIPSMKYKLSP